MMEQKIRGGQPQGTPARTVAFQDLSIEQAQELLRNLEGDEGIAGKAGAAIFDRQVPRWSVSLTMAEVASPAG